MKGTKGKIFVVILALFLVWNVSWLLITTIKYKGFVEKVPENEHGNYIHREEGYLYNVRKPEYLRFKGHLFVSAPNTKHVMIWPLLTGGYEYGFTLPVEEKNGSHTFYFNEKMELLQPENNEGIEIENYMDDIEDLLSKANEMWELE